MHMQSPTVSDEMPKRFRINESARHRGTRTFLMKCEEAVCRLSCETLRISALAVFRVMVTQRLRARVLLSAQRRKGTNSKLLSSRLTVIVVSQCIFRVAKHLKQHLK